jgi:alpha-tubulin suppressor-like RCC1 family protein
MVPRGLVVCIALGLAGCSLNVTVDGHFKCDDADPCPSGQACVNDVCQLNGTSPPAATCVGELGAGVSHACAIRDDGTAWCWGNNNFGQLGDGTTTARTAPVQVTAPKLPTFTAIAGGLEHTCAVGADKTVWCWGHNNEGQLGNGSTSDEHTPVQVAGITAATAIAAGDRHSCAIDGGAVACWGDNGLGQLGDGSQPSGPDSHQTQPVMTKLAAGVSMLAAGGDATCAITSDQIAECWGNGGQGQLGTGTATVIQSTPTPMALPKADALARAVALGDNFGCALTTNGNVYCSGDYEANQIGPVLGFPANQQPSLVQIPLAGPVTALVAGDELACAIDDKKQMWCWGADRYGQLADANVCDGEFDLQASCNRAYPTLTTFSDVTAAVAGHGFVCAITGDGLQCMGDNGLGQLGNGERSSNPEPQAVRGLTGVSALALGESFSCALHGDGSVACWGRNNHGQLGDGSRDPRDKPVGVLGVQGATQVVAGEGHACALVGGGNVVCWGRNEHGQLGDGTTSEHGVPRKVITDVASRAPLAGATQIAAGKTHTCAVLEDGTAMCWGENSADQLGGDAAAFNDHLTPVTATLGNGMALPKMSAIAAGDLHTCAIDATQQLWCWGSNAVGQTGLVNGSDCLNGLQTPAKVNIPGNLAVVEIVASELSTCARTIDNQVWCWGADGDGELGGNPTSRACAPDKVNGLAAASQIAIGNQHVCALLAGSDNPVCWARNCRGQVGAETYTSVLHANAYSLYTAPTAVQPLVGVQAIAAGAYHTCALLADGSVKCWGDDGDGELGDGAGRAPSPVAPTLTCPTPQ